jgi:ABC-type branched-subunit amino acid transport system ATPase component/nitrate/nitrite transporter NarK
VKTADELRLAELTSRLIEADAEQGSEPEQGVSAAPAEGAGPGPKEKRPPAPVVPLRAVLAAGGVAPVAILAVLNMVDLFERAAFSVLSPDIQRSFGLSKSALGAMAGLGGLMIVGAGVPIAMLADRHAKRRTFIAGIAAAVWAVFSLATGLASQLWQLLGARTLTGLGQASVEPVHGSLLSDYYPVEARSRVLSLHAWGAIAGMTAGPVCAGAIAKLAGGPDGWRLVFIITASMTVVPAALVLRLKSPVAGRAERRRVLGAARAEGESNDNDNGAPGQMHISFGTAVQRLVRIRTIYSLLVAFGIYGFTAVSAPVLLNLWFDNHWHLDEFQRGLIATVVAAVGLVAVPVGGVIGDRLASRHPAWPLVLLGLATAAHCALFTAALYLPSIGLVVALIAVSQLPILLVVVPVRAVLSKVAPPDLRSLAFTLIPLATLLIGGLLGGAIFGAIADQTGERFALTLLLPLGLVAALLMIRGARFTTSDIAAVEEEILEEADEHDRLRSGGSPELLQVRNLDFSYGPVQILFDVHLDVHEGEVLALLGTNGAGKSTLLSCISGLAHPTRGVVRYQGSNITFLETERIVRLGIEQVPGGRAVFPGLTVRENLLVATRPPSGFKGNGRKGDVTELWAEALSWFPVLETRMNQAAGTLSGGEQQMLALAKAFVNRPRLLLIDELSLGLAPAVVGQLMEVIRRMNAAGTTILIVEQSVNVALSIAHRAVFMEKGQVQFEGPADELLGRRDLLRSVFLGGAVKGEG